MESLEETIRKIFQVKSMTTQQLGMADLKEIEDKVVDLFKGKIIADQQKLEELIATAPKTSWSDREWVKKLTTLLGIKNPH